MNRRELIKSLAVVSVAGLPPGLGRVLHPKPKEVVPKEVARGDFAQIMSYLAEKKLMEEYSRISMEWSEISKAELQ